MNLQKYEPIYVAYTTLLYNHESVCKKGEQAKYDVNRIKRYVLLKIIHINTCILIAVFV